MTWAVPIRVKSGKISISRNTARKVVLALASYIVQQTGEPSEGLQRDWPQISTGVDKHYGYAFQWFGLSALIAVLYVWFQFVRNRQQRSA